MTGPRDPRAGRPTITAPARGRLTPVPALAGRSARPRGPLADAPWWCPQPAINRTATRGGDHSDSDGHPRRNQTAQPAAWLVEGPARRGVHPAGRGCLRPASPPRRPRRGGRRAAARLPVGSRRRARCRSRLAGAVRRVLPAGASSDGDQAVVPDRPGGDPGLVCGQPRRGWRLGGGDGRQRRGDAPRGRGPGDRWGGRRSGRAACLQHRLLALFTLGMALSLPNEALPAGYLAIIAVAGLLILGGLGLALLAARRPELAERVGRAGAGRFARRRPQWSPAAHHLRARAHHAVASIHHRLPAMHHGLPAVHHLAPGVPHRLAVGQHLLGKASHVAAVADLAL